MFYYLYIFRCTDNKLYIGTTHNLSERIKWHNEGKGPNFTRIRLPVKLVYFEKFDNLKSARRREKQIKGWRREKKESLKNMAIRKVKTIKHLTINLTNYSKATQSQSTN